MAVQQRKPPAATKSQGLKEHREKMALRQAKRVEKQHQQAFIVFGVRVAIALLATMALAAGIYVAFFGNGVTSINPEDAGQLQEVSTSAHLSTMSVQSIWPIGVSLWQSLGSRLR